MRARRRTVPLAATSSSFSNALVLLQGPTATQLTTTAALPARRLWWRGAAGQAGPFSAARQFEGR
jgi:hypothetical protein